MTKAASLGVLVIVVFGAVTLVPLVDTSIPDWLLALVSVSPLVSSLLTSWVAPERKVLLGTLMFVPGTVVVLGVTGLYQAAGRPVDFPGLSGARILAGITIGWNLPACWVVANVGAWVSTRRSRRNAAQRAQRPHGECPPDAGR